jgi:hypothetical protein
MRKGSEQHENKIQIKITSMAYSFSLPRQNESKKACMNRSIIGIHSLLTNQKAGSWKIRCDR